MIKPTSEQLSQIKKRCKAATRGPWQLVLKPSYQERKTQYYAEARIIATKIDTGAKMWNEKTGKWDLPVKHEIVSEAYVDEALSENGKFFKSMFKSGKQCVSDIDFIAHARTDIPMLLDYVEYLESELKKVRK